MKIQLLDNSGKLVDADIKVTSKNILVLKVDSILSLKDAEKIKERITEAINNNKVLLLDKNCSLQVLTIEDDE